MKRKRSLKSVLLGICVLPLIVMALILSIVSNLNKYESMQNSTFEILRGTAKGLAKYNANSMSKFGSALYEHSYVDLMKAENIEQTVFLEDKRFVSSILKENSYERNEGTTADPEIYEIVKSGKEYRAKNVMICGQKYYVYYIPIKNTFGKFLGMAAAAQPVQVVQKAVITSILMMFIVTIIVTILLSIVFISCANLLRKSIVQVASDTMNLSKGNLATEINEKSRILEISNIVDAVKQLKTSLSDIMSKVDENAVFMNDSTIQIAEGIRICNDASAQITSAVSELNKGTMDMAESVNTCSTSMQEIGDEISLINTQANTANDKASYVLSISEKAKADLVTLLDANSKTAMISKDVVLGINEANQAAEQIKAAATAITEIASETSLLSLNASIEAARAGEAGAGFAVVASSIQSLANQVDQSAKEIQSVIENIIKTSEKNVALANRIKQAVNQEDVMLTDVSHSFEIVNVNMKETAEAMSNISEKATTLNQAKNTVIEEIMTLSAISEENAASCQETSASMEELKANIETIQNQSLESKSVSDQLSAVITYFSL